MDTKNMTLQEFQDFILHHKWTFAKTMPKFPHSYVVRENCRNDEEFVNAVVFIRAHGMPRKFYRKTYTYLDLDNFTYWTMGNSLDITKIINRSEINE